MPVRHAPQAVVLCSALLLLGFSAAADPISALVALLTLVAVGGALVEPALGLAVLPLSVAWANAFPVNIGPFPVTLTDLIVAAVGLAWLRAAGAVGAHSLLGPWAPYLALFLAALVLSIPQALDWHAAARETVKWSEVAFVYLATMRFLDTDRKLAWVVLGALVGGASQAVLGFAQFALQLGPAAFRHGQFLRAYGTFDQPNPYAGYLNMTVGFALAALLLYRGPRRLGAGICLAGIFGALVVSESRGALIAGVFATLAIGACHWRSAAFLTRLGAFCAVGGAWGASLGVLPLSPFDRVLTAVGLGNVSFQNVNNVNYSAVERAAHWLTGVRIFAAHPVVGVGIGNYQVAYPAFHPRGWYAPLAHAHNYYINIAAEAGILGLTTYVLLVGSALWYSYAAKDRVRLPVHRCAVLGALGALLATDIHNLFDVLYVHGMATMLGLLVGLVPASVRLAANRGAETFTELRPSGKR